MNIRYAFVVSVALVVVSLTSCSTMRPLLLDQVDPNNCALVEYAGTSMTMELSLYKINGKPRVDYLENTMFWTYTQPGSLGFSVQVPVGINSFEFVNLKNNEIVNISADLSNSKYQLEIKNDYKIFEIANDNSKKNIDLTIEKVIPYKIQSDVRTGLLVIENKSDNKIVLFRINKFAPPILDQKLVGNFIYNNFTKPYTINLLEGLNTIEIGVTGRTSGTSGQKYFVVHKLDINVQSGKTYKLALETKTINKIAVINPIVIEN